MGYYMMGDYRTGGYYSGDPGLFSFAKRLVKKAPNIVKGLATGGIAGAVMGGFEKIPGSSKVGPMPVATTRGSIVGAAGRAIPKILKRLPPGSIPGAIGGAVLGEALDIFMDGNGCCPTGYHPAKDGSGRCVRNRRMNICNPKALRRSMRRVQGFEKLAKRTITFTKRTRMKTTRRKAC